MQPSAETSITEDFIIPLSSLSSTTSPGIVYVSFTRDSPEEYASGSFQCVLKFVSKELDPSTGKPEEEGYEDEYQLEEVELGAGDYIVPTYVTFSSEWDRMRGGASATETFSLSAMESLKGGFMSPAPQPWLLTSEMSFSTAACDSIIEILNMQPLGGTEDPGPTTVHTLQLAGLVVGAGGTGKALVRCRMAYSKAQGVTLELGVRAEKQEACSLIISAIGG
jgi:coatomer subunit gamma